MGSTFMSAEPPEPKSLISLLMRRSLSIAIYRESFVISVSSAILAIRFIHNADCGNACAAACPNLMRGSPPPLPPLQTTPLLQPQPTSSHITVPTCTGSTSTAVLAYYLITTASLVGFEVFFLVLVPCCLNGLMKIINQETPPCSRITLHPQNKTAIQYNKSTLRNRPFSHKINAKMR